MYTLIDVLKKELINCFPDKIGKSAGKEPIVELTLSKPMRELLQETLRMEVNRSADIDGTDMISPFCYTELRFPSIVLFRVKVLEEMTGYSMCLID